jgi:hypothetical protein
MAQFVIHALSRHSTWPASGSSTPSIIHMAVVMPGPVGADEPEHLPVDDGEGQVVEGD